MNKHKTVTAKLSWQMNLKSETVCMPLGHVAAYSCTTRPGAVCVAVLMNAKSDLAAGGQNGQCQTTPIEPLVYNPIFDNALSVEEYVAVNQETASLIELSGEYKLLDKIYSIPSDDKYCLDFGFGTIIFYENKYQAINHENIVYYEMSSYPDFSFSKGNYVTQIYISDKEVEFNGITLNNSFNEICDLYKS